MASNACLADIYHRHIHNVHLCGQYAIKNSLTDARSIELNWVWGTNDMLLHRGADRGLQDATFVLGVVETLLIAAAVCASTLYLSDHATSPANGFAFSLSIVAIIVAVMHLTGLYGATTIMNLRAAFSRIAVVTGLVFGLAVVATGLLAKYDIVPIYPYRWQWTFVLTAIWLACVIAPRIALRHLIERGYFERRIIAISDNAGSLRLNEMARNFPGRFVMAAQLSSTPPKSYSEIATLSAKYKAPEIVVAVDHMGAEPLIEGPVALPVTDYAAFYEREAGRVNLDVLQPGWLAEAQGPNAGVFEKACRRGFDIIVALVAFAVVAPVMLLVALAIRIEDGKPILFRQTRVGLNGREFTLYKFRSMRVDAESGTAPVWAAENDPRITRVGSLIRKLRIDELPQFYNVLRGDMSFIGPRPERPYFVHQLSELIPFYNDRHCVKPGITGWAQASFHYGASLEDARHKTAFDLYYVKHRGILLDFLIILRTIKVVLWPQGVR